MSWVQSLQSKLDEVQSSIDSRLEKSTILDKAKATAQEPALPSLSESMRSSLAVLDGKGRGKIDRPAVEEDDDEDAAWPSLSAAAPVPAKPVLVEAAVEPPLARSGYEDVDALVRAGRLARSCGSVLDEAAAGAAELELRVADAADARSARAAGRKAVGAQIRAWRASEIAGDELVGGVTAELEACGRLGRDAEAALRRAVEACGAPAIKARATLEQVTEAIDAAETAARAARADAESTREDEHRGMKEIANIERRRASRATWRLARAGLRLLARQHRKVGIVVDAPEEAGSDAATEGSTLQDALLAFRLDALESQKAASTEARKALAVARTCREKVKDLKRRHVSPPVTARDGAAEVEARLGPLARPLASVVKANDAALDRLKTECADFKSRALAAESDGAALAEAAAAKLTAARKKAAEAARETEAARQEAASLREEIDGLKHAKASTHELDAVRAEAAASARRAVEASAVAKEALAELDRERANRKTRELGSLKTLNEQLRASRVEAAENRDLAANANDRLANEVDAHCASTVVCDALAANAASLRVEIAQLADNMIKAAAGRRDADHRARDLSTALETARNNQQVNLDALRADLDQAHARELRALRDRIAEQAREVAALRMQQNSNVHDAEDPPEPARTPKHNKTAPGQNKRLVSVSRILFFLYALALHALTYFALQRCGLQPTDIAAAKQSIARFVDPNLLPDQPAPLVIDARR